MTKDACYESELDIGNLDNRVKLNFYLFKKVLCYSKLS